MPLSYILSMYLDNIDMLYRMMELCTICPRNCRVNRLKGETGFCGMPAEPVISSYGPHFGEEPPLVGSRGSGTIFMTGCNLGCIFCQNYDISHLRRGNKVSVVHLAELMLTIQDNKCHNINFVTPTHFTPQIMDAVRIAREKGLEVPLVYNCGGYESLDTLRLLEGGIEIYMPDAKYWDKEAARELSSAPDYPEVMRDALREMHRQVGVLTMDQRGIAVQGLLIRHLVMPNGLAGTREIMEFIARELSQNSYVNVMAQYRPMYKGVGHSRIGRALDRREYREAVEMALAAGLHRGFPE